MSTATLTPPPVRSGTPAAPAPRANPGGLHRTFRPDVEGLRAVAVGLVVLYHCNGVIPGGYVGVDIFFVISGFLITSQLVRELTRTGTISLRGFYARRVRRILPAATVTTVATILMAGVLLPPLAALRVFDDARAAALFGANFHFAAVGADYFSNGLPPSPLQHYWSLSVEEQFYVVWPLLLAVSSLAWVRVRRCSAGHGIEVAARAARPRISLVVAVLGVVTALSFICSVQMTRHAPTEAYYSILSRGWELAAGALVALSLPVTGKLDRRLAVGLSWLGLGCIVLAASTFGASTSFPGAAALLPVAGAAAIIAAGAAASRRWGAESMLGVPPLQKLGGLSYSWYLWHWPVLILAPAVLGHSLSTLEALAMAALSLIIALLSFLLVERPIRRMTVLVRRPLLGIATGAALIATTMTAAALAGTGAGSLTSGQPVAPPSGGSGGQLTPAQLALDLTEGAQTRQVPSNLTPSLTAAALDRPLVADDGCLAPNPAVSNGPCVFGDRSSHNSVVLFGDSHAAAWFPALNLISQQNHWRLVVLTKSGCPAAAVGVIRYGRVFASCPVWRRYAERRITAIHPKLLVIAFSEYLGGVIPLGGGPVGSVSTWMRGTAATFRLLRRAAVHVVFISDPPKLRQGAPDCVSAHLSNVQACDVSRGAAVGAPEVRSAELALAASDGITPINPLQWFCTATVCPMIVGNILIYSDAQHMDPQWSRFVAPVLSGVITPLVGTSRRA